MSKKPVVYRPNVHYSRSYYIPGHIINFIKQESELTDRSESGQFAFYMRQIMKNPEGFNVFVQQNKSITNNSHNTTVNSNNTIEKEKNVGNLNVGHGASVHISISDETKPRRK